jgi:hypothetical protein
MMMRENAEVAELRFPAPEIVVTRLREGRQMRRFNRAI